jgi:GTP pyrophosphokinase
VATVDRVLPWRRQAAPADQELAPLVAAYRDHHPRASTALVIQAYEAAARAHDGQTRKSGEPYVTHPLAVAKIVAELGLDDVTIAAAS